MKSILDIKQMEVQIKKCLISMRKISNLTGKSRIDTTNGDIYEFVDTPYNSLYRAVWDSRPKAIKLLIKKFAEIKEITRFIMESRRFTGNLRTIRHSLENTKEGLTLYKGNLRYVNDMKIKSTVEHILEDEIPSQLAIIHDYCQKNKIEETDLVVIDDIPDAPKLTID